MVFYLMLFTYNFEYIMLLDLLVILYIVKIMVKFDSLYKMDNLLYDIYCIFILNVVDDFIILVRYNYLRINIYMSIYLMKTFIINFVAYFQLYMRRCVQEIDFIVLLHD